ncbi:DUF421 domain-containing protein [Clostridium sp. C8-1-8]|uniref:DUF421 domain-containing protein n=1 Tax=Clostridium sp. C8-1-8 TaxID=2698831 RepID=UPI00136B7490|nr:DUF421 domain-containing protein [Clostridium sp. C8-1-8]
MDIFHFIYKPLIIFFVLFILVRLTGKKSLSQITYFDYVSAITIGTIAGSITIEDNVGIIKGIVVMLVWILIPVIMSYIGSKNLTFQRKTVGEPIILIRNGTLDYNNLKKTKYNIEDLLMQLRKKEVFDISEVEFALLEVDGELSILKKSAYNSVTPKDLNISTPYKGLTLSLIINGRILESNLALSGKDKSWLNNQLKQKNMDSVEDVIYCGYTSDERLELFAKTEHTT